VVLTKSLHGSLAFPIVLMLGLYIFWLYVLIGGVISYAVQKTSTSPQQPSRMGQPHRIHLRERLYLVRAFRHWPTLYQKCLPPTSASQLGDLLKVPTAGQRRVPRPPRRHEADHDASAPSPAAPPTEYLYQPARPLNRISLYEFKNLDDRNLATIPWARLLGRSTPVLRHHNDALDKLGETPFSKKSLEELFIDHPLDGSAAALQAARLNVEPPHPTAAVRVPSFGGEDRLYGIEARYSNFTPCHTLRPTSASHPFYP